MRFDNHDCQSFVDACTSRMERLVYKHVSTGAQRADLFRVYFLRSMGGIYADADTEHRLPLSTFVPPNASAVVGSFWDFSFMAFEPYHPILRELAHRATTEVVYQLGQLSTNSPWRCQGSTDCVLAVTGPLQYDRAILHVSHHHGCHNLWWRPQPAKHGRAADCANASDSMRRIHICDDPHWQAPFCGAVEHLDCHNSRRSRKCSPDHYSKVQSFFKLAHDGLSQPSDYVKA